MAYRENKTGDRGRTSGRAAARPGRKPGFSDEKNTGIKSGEKTGYKTGRKSGIKGRDSADYQAERKFGKKPGKDAGSRGETRTAGNQGEDRYTKEKAAAERALAQIRDRAIETDEEVGDAAVIEGRNAVMEAFRAGRAIDRLYILDGCHDGPVLSIKREAQKHSAMIKYVEKERLDQLSETGRHQGVIAIAAAYEYASVEDMLQAAREKQEPPFLILLDNIEDPHNLGAIIRTANLAGAHGVIIPKNRAVGLTATVARTSAGALNYTPVAKVTNLAKTIEELKEEGLWFVCADMKGTPMYQLDMKGPIGLVIGSEGEGVGRLVKEKCDMSAAIPMKGNIDSLNASVAAGVLAYEIVRQRLG